MKSITKTTPNPALAQAHRKPPPTPEAAANRWGAFRKKGKKQQTREYLLAEQHSLCGYTEVNLLRFEHGMHIEHIAPKAVNPTRTFDYENLIVSALDSQSLGLFIREDRFGGHFKLNKFDEEKFISPLMSNSESYFRYQSNGHISPAAALNSIDEERANYTIDLLNLNASFLVAQRRGWFDELFETIDDIQERVLTREQQLLKLKQFAQAELSTESERLSSYYSVTKFVLSKFLDE